MATRKRTKPQPTGIVRSAEPLETRRTVQIGRARKGDVSIPIRVGVETANRLKEMAGTDGVINIPEEAFRKAMDQLVNPKPTNQAEPAQKSVLDQAREIIYGDREKTYGRPQVNLQSIADFWTTYLQRRAVVTGVNDTVTINDVCQMMVLLKTARLLNDPTHLDSLIDQAGYVALQERCVPK